MCPAAASAMHPASIRPRDRLDRDGAAVDDVEAGDLAMLDDVDAQAVGAAGEAPRDLVVARHAAPALQGGAHHRVADVGGDVHDRAEGAHLLGGQPLGVDAVQPIGVHPAHARPSVAEVVRQVQDAPLAELDVDAEVRLQPLPELQGVLVDGGALVPEIVRADDRGVPGHVAPAEPSLLEDGDVRDPVVPGEVVRGREAVAAPADDDDVVGGSRLGGTPIAIAMICVVIPGHRRAHLLAAAC